MAKSWFLSALGVLVVGWNCTVFAGGLTFYHNGAAAIGKGDAFTGEANDPSAIYWNPAGISQMAGTQVMAGGSLAYFDTTFQSAATGESTALQDQFPVVPFLYMTHRLKSLNEKVTIGLGV